MSVVFGTTLCPDARPLAEAAARLAHRLEAPLRLVHVAEDPRAPLVLGSAEEHVLGTLREDLDREAERLRSATGATIQAHLAAGPIAEALTSLAELELASVVIVGAGTAGLRTLFEGVADRVSRRSRVPALTIRDAAALEAWLAGQRALRILVGADLGRAATAARAFAALLRKVGPCEVRVVMVASPVETHRRLGLAPPTHEHALAADAEDALLRDLAKAAPEGEGDVAVSIVAGRGSADVHLAAQADQGDIDLIVVGQRRRSMLQQIWYESVARGILRAAATNVACVPPPLAERPPSVARPCVVVVAAAFTDADRPALAQSIALVEMEGELHVAHVVDPRAVAADVPELRHDAWSRLGRLAGQFRAEGPARMESHVVVGDPAEQLRALCRRVGADMLVLGVRERAVAGRARVGAVARALIETSEVPVVIVPVREI